MQIQTRLYLLILLFLSILRVAAQDVTVRGRFVATSINDVVEYKNTLWVATNSGGLYEYNIKERRLEYQYHILNSVLKENDISDIAVNKHGTLYIKSFKRLYKLEKGKLRTVELHSARLSAEEHENGMRSIEFDKKGQLWINFFRHGIAVVGTDSLTFIKNTIGLKSLMPLAKKGFVAVDTNEIVTLDIKGIRKRQRLDTNLLYKAQWLVMDDNQSIWGIKRRRMHPTAEVYQLQSKEVVTHANLYHQDCRYRLGSLSRGKAGDIYALENKNLIKYDGKKWQILARNIPLLMQNRSIYADKNDDVWTFSVNRLPRVWNGTEWEEVAGNPPAEPVIKDNTLYSDEGWYYFKNLQGLFACKDQNCNFLYENPKAQNVGRFFIFGDNEKRMLRFRGGLREMEVFKISPDSVELITKLRLSKGEYARAMIQRGDSILYATENSIRYFNPFFNRISDFRVDVKMGSRRKSYIYFTDRFDIWRKYNNGYQKYDLYHWSDYPIDVGRMKHGKPDISGFATDNLGRAFTVGQRFVYRTTENGWEQIAKLNADLMGGRCTSFHFAFKNNEGFYLAQERGRKIHFFDYRSKKWTTYELPHGKRAFGASGLVYNPKTDRLLVLSMYRGVLEYDFSTKESKNDKHLERYNAKLKFDLKELRE